MLLGRLGLKSEMSLLLRLFFIGFGLMLCASGQLAASGTPEQAQAGELVDQGWRLLSEASGSAYFSSRPQQADNGKTTPAPDFEPICDRPEIAAGLFEKAVSADESLFWAWLGWGKALERLALCPAGSEMSWLEQRLGLGRDEARPKRHKPYVAAALKKAYEAAEEKYEKAAELDPENAEIKKAWAGNLLVRAKAETNIEISRALAEKALFELYPRYVELSLNSPAALKDWGRSLLSFIPYETEETGWRRLLKTADDCLAKGSEQIKMEAEAAAAHPESFRPGQTGGQISDAAGKAAAASSAPGPLPAESDSKKARRLYQMELLSMYKHAAETCNEEDSAKIKAIFTAAVASQEGFEIEAGDNEYYHLEAIAGLYLALARVEEDESVWQRNMAEAGKWLKKADEARPAEMGSPVAYGPLIRAAEMEKRENRRQLMLLKALAIMDKIPESQWGLAREDGRGPLLNHQAARLALNYIALYWLLPEGAVRNRLAGKMSRSFEEALAALKGSESLLISVWGRAVARQAGFQSDPGRIEEILREAESKMELLREVGSYKNEFLYTYAHNLNSVASQIANLQVKRLCWEAVIAAFDKYGVNENSIVFDRQAMYELLVNAHLSLEMTSAGDRNKSEEGLHYADALIVQHNKVLPDKSASSVFNGMLFRGDELFNLAQMTLGGYVKYSDRSMLDEALTLYRDHFDSLLERDDHGNGYMLSLASRSDSGEGGNPYQKHLTSVISHQVREIHQALAGREYDNRDRLMLAGLLRHLLAAGYLTAEYQDLYRGRAAGYLRQVIESEALRLPAAGGGEAYAGHALELKADPAAELWFEKALARAELGLLLAEETLPAGTKTGLPPETETLWAEAEKDSPGSTRYARARWAAWRGDKEEAAAHLKYVNDSGRRFFPYYSEAVQDPAFADFKGEAWFKRIWYGLN